MKPLLRRYRWLERVLGLHANAPLPRELLKFDPVWNERVGAQAALLVFLVAIKVAFEPLDVAVAFERQDMRRQTI